MTLKPETHRAIRWPSEAFGEMSLGANPFSVFSCLTMWAAGRWLSVCFNAIFQPDVSDERQCIGWIKAVGRWFKSGRRMGFFFSTFWLISQ